MVHTKSVKGLLAKYGPKRVIDTPIAEAGFAGIGIGSAMVGLRPIVEFMSWNFSLIAFDQIVNNAAKMLSMSGGNFNVPIVFRGPGGAAHNLAATHSQALESLYAHFPGLKVVMPSNPRDAKGLLKTAIRDNNPVIFIESEVMYGEKGEIPEGEYTIPFGQRRNNSRRKRCDNRLLVKNPPAYHNESGRPACRRKYQR